MDDQVKRSCEASLIVQTCNKNENARNFEAKPSNYYEQQNDSQKGWGRLEGIKISSVVPPSP